MKVLKKALTDPSNEVQVVFNAAACASQRPRGFLPKIFFPGLPKIGRAWRLSGLMGAVGEVRKKKLRLSTL